jgi:hypothetical protein
MTTVVIRSRLLFGPNPDGQTEAHISSASFETSEESPEGLVGMYPRGRENLEPHEKDYRHEAAPPLSRPDHHHHRPHARETDHHHRPHERETAASVTRMTPEQAAAMGVDMNGHPLAHRPRAHETTGHFTKENADSVRATAKRLGISARDLSTIIGYETIGSYSPSKRGLRH